ncbi:MAG: hypothetical protein B6U76_06395 [Desulfurococcales archaeon ex4484_217_2]|nr:MAG: hypothetical protein B6U76_06395 [Desulfurococcales archaeon ex4484_217_2]
MKVNIDLSRIVFLKDKNLKGFRITLINDIRALEKVFSLLGKSNMPVHYILVSKANAEKYSALVYLSSECNENFDEIDKRFKESYGVISVEKIEPLVKGVLANTLNGHLSWEKDKVILIKRDIVENMISDLMEKYGSIFLTILYHMGFSLGLNAYERNVETLKKLNVGNEVLLKYALAIFKMTGNGKAEIVGFDERNKVVSMKIVDSFEYDAFRNVIREGPYLHFTRGMWAGWFTGFFSEEMIAKEVKCEEIDGSSMCHIIIHKAPKKVIIE